MMIIGSPGPKPLLRTALEDTRFGAVGGRKSKLLLRPGSSSYPTRYAEAMIASSREKAQLCYEKHQFRYSA
jgi:hypothetical protein